MEKQQFTCQLAEWHASANKRQLPWKEETDAYKIWLSEIILQQTRAGMAVKYYAALSQKYPTIRALAAAPDAEVFKLWEGLGYYSRCRNLLATARFIVNERSGQFPESYAGILQLKGIGPYTAAAIASFAFNLPHAVLDGNVFRVLARCFGIETAIDTTEGKKLFADLANDVLNKEQPAKHNQAIMDFGATVCKPIGPLCDECPLQYGCVAYATGRTNVLPRKEKILQKKTRWFTYFIISAGGKTMVRQRNAKDVWQQLFEFYLLETENNKVWTDNEASHFIKHQLDLEVEPLSVYVSPQLSQQLTHQTIHAIFIKVKLKQVPPSLSQDLWVNNEELKQLTFPKIINEFLGAGSFPAVLF